MHSAFLCNAEWLPFVASAIASFFGVAAATFALIAAPQTVIGRADLWENTSSSSDKPTPSLPDESEVGRERQAADDEEDDEPRNFRDAQNGSISVETDLPAVGDEGAENGRLSPSEIVGIISSFSLNLGLVAGAYIAIAIGPSLQPKD